MKIIKKIITFILSFILTILISMLIISFTFKETLVEDILFQGFKSTIVGKTYKEKSQTLDDIITEDGVITDNEFVNEILESKEIKDLVNNYVDKIIEIIGDEELSDEKMEELNIEQDMINYIKENKKVLEDKTGIEITDEMIETASIKLNERDTKKVLKQTIKNTRNNISPETKQLLKLYQIIVSTKLKIFLLLGIIIDIILIAILKKSTYKWLKTIANSTVIAAISTIIISTALKYLLSIMLNNMTIKTNKMLGLSIIVLIIGIVLNIIYFTINKIVKNKKGDNDEISKVLE